MKKRVLSLVMVFCMALSLLPTSAWAVDPNAVNTEEKPDTSRAVALQESGSSGLSKLNQSEITQLLEENPLDVPNAVFETDPSLTAPYAPGKVSDASLQTAVDRLNALRRIAGLPPATMDSALNENAQYGAVLLAVSEFSHTPSKLTDMDDGFFESGRKATESSNIFTGTSHYFNLPYSVDSFMDDSDASNINRVGHRRWQLNPSMGKVGFGYALNEGMCYIAEKAHDTSGSDVNYNFIAWPASGNFPTGTFFNKNTAWSVTLNPKEYNQPDSNSVTVKLVRNDDGKEWNLSNGSSAGYFNIENNGYGVSNCIIFRPSGIDSYNGTYTATIEGLVTKSGESASLSYQVDFFDPKNESPDEPPAPNVYPVTVNAGANGTARVSKNSAQAGEAISVTATPANGYELDRITYTPAGGAAVDITSAKTFTMPAANVTVNVTFKAIPAAGKQELSFASSTVTKTYGDNSFTEIAANRSEGGGNVTYSSSNEAVATVAATTGEVTIKGAGTAVITATAAEVAGTWAQTSVSYTLTVSKAPLTVDNSSVTLKAKTYDGTNAGELAGTISFNGLVGTQALTKDKDYTVKAVYSDANAGDNKTAQVTVTLLDTPLASNYTLTSGTVSLTGLTVAKAAAPALKTMEIVRRYNDTAERKVDLAKQMPTGAGELTYRLTVESDTDSIIGTWAVKDGAPVMAFKSGLSFKEGVTAELTAAITSTNYQDATVTVKVTLTDKDMPVVDADDIEIVYTGKAPDITGTATYEGKTVEGSWSWADKPPVNVKDSGSYTVNFAPRDTDTYYHIAPDTILVTIKKATPSGTPSYTPITTSGKTLADAELGIGSIKPAGGSIAWDKESTTAVTANTAYSWTYTPADTDNYTVLTGKLTPYSVRPSGGGGSSGGGGGSRVDVSVGTGSSSHGKITASPSTAHKGDKVTLNIRPDSGYELKEVIVRDSDGKQISVEQVNGTRYTFVMPSGKVTVEPVFEKITQTPTPTPTPGSTRFYDIPAGAYYAEAVQWAIEKGITNGTTDSTFSPNATCTRAQMVTFLWRAAGSPAPNGRGQSFKDISAGAYYYDAVLWAVEQGITNGATATTFDPEGTVTRAQTVTFLYRAAGSPKADSRASFSDVASGAYYADAIGWAAEQAITNGTTATTFSPANGCTRAQIVTFLYRANT